jgi:uncharacterized protein with von Willebrand factor type A (vWA) domain
MAEAMDAGEALRHTPITDRQIFKTALQSVLVKEHQDIPAFDAAFERFFLVQLTDQDDLNGPESDENKESPETQPNLCNEQDDGEQEGEVTQEDGEQEASMPGEEEGDSSEEAEESVYDVEEMLARIQVGELTSEAMTKPGKQPRRNGTEDIDLYQELPPGQVENLYDAVEEMAANLVTRRSLRYRNARYGQVDIKRTLQRSFRTGNIPLHIVRKRRKINKHE